MMDRPLLMGAVAYDPKVVTIWGGFRSWFRQQGLDFDFVLYSNYERQVEDLVAQRIDAAWNSPLAWVRASRLAAQAGVGLTPVVMRDSDQDLTSLVLVRSDSGVERLEELSGLNVGVGAIDSPQATLIPLGHIRSAGLEPGSDFRVKRFDVGVGLHGDHIGGERDAARALVRGEIDACCIIDTNHLLFSQEGTIPQGSVRVIAQTPPYDHCNMTLGDWVPAAQAAGFTDLLLGMSYGDPTVRPLLDFEGLKEWRPGRASGYPALERAVDASRFMDGRGQLLDPGYVP